MDAKSRKKRQRGSNESSEAPTTAPPTAASCQNNTGTTTRRRVACQSCRLRKVKCDGARPVCALCKTSGWSCEYLEAGERLTLESATKSLIERLSSLQKGIDRLNEQGTRDDLSAIAHFDFGSLASTRPVSPVPTQDFNAYIFESSKDYLEIPAHKNCADSVLTWEIFEGRYQKNNLIESLFVEKKQEVSRDENLSRPQVGGLSVGNSFQQPDEERIPSLVDNFLQNVHTKNPILDVETLVAHARVYARNGVGWDAWSCLVLMACAVGSVAKPFDSAATLSPVMRARLGRYAALPPDSSADIFARELQNGAAWFSSACRRLGSLTNTLISAHCYFYAGVYLMYILKPLHAWQYFHQASTLYDLYLKIEYGTSRNMADVLQSDGQQLQHQDYRSQKQQRLESTMYWSCFKSECEFRVELPLPQSQLASFQHPNLFPSPPSPIEDTEQPTGPGSRRHSIAEMSYFSTSSFSGSMSDEQELRQHAKELCNEEESWYYYLTEIALRRIGNRIINTFFRDSPKSWVNIKPLLRIALEFDDQVSSWSAHLPPAMRYYETTSTIRDPNLTPLGSSSISDCVSHEMSWAIDNRLLEMRCWLYQPFVYFLVHSRDAALASPISRPHTAASTPLRGSSGAGTLPEMPSSAFMNYEQLNEMGELSTGGTTTPLPDLDANVVLNQLITAGISCNMRLMEGRGVRHRHHGLWFDLRSIVCACLTMLAVVKGGRESWIPGGVEVLWGASQPVGQNSRPGTATGMAIGGKVASAIEALDFWSKECPTLRRHTEVIREVTQTTKSEWQRRNFR